MAGGNGVSEQKNIIKLSEKENIDLTKAEFVCIPSKQKYAQVELCIRPEPGYMSFTVGEIDTRRLSFDDRIKIGKEIESRCKGANMDEEIVLEKIKVVGKELYQLDIKNIEKNIIHACFINKSTLFALLCVAEKEGK